MIYHVTYANTGGINTYVRNLKKGFPEEHHIFEIERGAESRTIQQLLRTRPDVQLVLHDPSFLSQIKTATSMSLSLVLHGDNSYYYSAVEGYGQYVDAIISVSETITSKIPHRFQHKTLTLGPCIFPANKYAQATQTGKVIQLIFVAREDQNKGVHHLPTLDKQISQKGYDVKWTIVLGSRPEKITPFRSWISKNKPRIKILENQPNHQITQLISNHNALILPSKTEGHPMVLIEALSLSVPPFTFFYTATCENHLPTDPEGIVSPSLNPTELAERVIRHHQRSPKSLRKWQDAARDYVELQHNPRRQAETLRRFLASLPPRNKSPLKQSYYKWKRRTLIIFRKW